MNKNKFSLKNYPKSYGSIDEFRFQSFLNLGENKLNILEAELWIYIKSMSIIRRPLKEYNNLKYLGSGWEWSVFKKDKNTVVKIPAGIFPEVGEEKYLINTKKAYEKINIYFPPEYIAKSEFLRNNSQNMIIQEFINGSQKPRIDPKNEDKKFLKNLDTFLKSLVLMLKSESWIPDLNIGKIGKYYSLRLMDKNNNLPKVTDFTYYYDPFRLFPSRTEKVVKEKMENIREFQMAIAKELYN